MQYIVALAFLALAAAEEVSPPAAVVVQPVANLFSRPSLDADVVSQAIYSTNVWILETHAGWARVRTQDDYKGWVESAALVAGRYAAAGRIAEVEWDPKVRQPVKTHLSLNGKGSHELVSQIIHQRVQGGRREAAGIGGVTGGSSAGV